MSRGLSWGRSGAPLLSSWGALTEMGLAETSVVKGRCSLMTKCFKRAPSPRLIERTRPLFPQLDKQKLELSTCLNSVRA